jgi:hypothetical protein
MRRSSLVLLLLLILAALCWSLLPKHKTPPHQPPLADLNEQSLPGLQADFNRTSDGLRVVLLLSPT